MMMQMQVANDLGYSSAKISINNRDYRVPSTVVAQRSQDITKPIDLTDLPNADDYMENFLDHLDVTIQSPAVAETKRFYVGNRAINSGLNTRNFDINDLQGKSDTDLALILPLSIIAGEAVRQSYKENGKLDFKPIDVAVKMSTALPILEGKRDQTVQNYEQRFLKGPHQVTVRNFDQLQTVNINFERVFVAMEGEIAQYRIFRSSKDFANKLLAAFKETSDIEITADQLIHAENVMGVDVGEGTTDLPVFEPNSTPNTAPSINIHSSSSLPYGYGRSLDDAVDYVQSMKLNVRNRQDLKEFLNSDNPFTKQQREMVQSAVDDQLDALTGQIVDAVSKTLSHSNNISVIYVYGGGSVPVKSRLQSALFEKTKAFSAGVGIPVVYIPSEFAPYMNEAGLELLLKLMEES